MNLDEPQTFADIDPGNILEQIDRLPEQIEAGWQAGLELPLPDRQGIRQVVIAGAGPSGLAGELLASHVAPLCPAAIHVLPGANLPAYATGPDTLVIGLEQESGAVLQSADGRGCCILEGDSLLATLPPAMPPALSSGNLYAALLAAFYRMELLPDPRQELQDALVTLRSQRQALGAGSPLARNPAKRQAGQMMGRWVKIIGSGRMAPAARHWKIQVNLLAKSWAEWEGLSGMEQASFAGTMHPDERLPRSMVVFLRARSDLPEERRRLNRARKAFMLDGIGTDTYDAPGPGPLADQWAAVQFGSYTAYYLAMCYDLDPAPPAVIPAAEG